MTAKAAPVSLDHMGFNLTVHRPGGFTREQQDSLFDAIVAAVCDDETEDHVCPLQNMGSCVGDYDSVYRWHMWTWDAVEAIREIDPESHATKSRDYGRGFAEALRLVREAIEAAKVGPVDGPTAKGDEVSS